MFLRVVIKIEGDGIGDRDYSEVEAGERTRYYLTLISGRQQPVASI